MSSSLNSTFDSILCAWTLLLKIKMLLEYVVKLMTKCHVQKHEAGTAPLNDFQVVVDLKSYTRPSGRILLQKLFFKKAFVADGETFSCIYGFISLIKTWDYSCIFVFWFLELTSNKMIRHNMLQSNLNSNCTTVSNTTHLLYVYG